MSSESFYARFRRFPIGLEWIAASTGIAIALAVFFYAPVVTEIATMLSIAIFCVSFWIATPVAPWFTALIGIGLIGISFSTDLALTGFNSAATWLVVAGILIGEATRVSGLAIFVERWLLTQVPRQYQSDVQTTYLLLLVVLCLAAFGFAVVVPSSLVRVLILAPILITLGEHFDSKQVRLGLLLGPLFATYYGGTGILTGSLANIIVTGIAESATEQTVTWTEWAAHMGAIMGLGRVIVVMAVVYYLYRPPQSESGALSGMSNLGSTNSEENKTEYISREQRMMLFLIVGVAIWITDSLHGLHPLYGALLVVVLAYSPKIGVAEFETIREADFSIVFFLGAVFAIAEGLRRTGFTNTAAQVALDTIPSDAPLALVLIAVVAIALALTFLMEGLAVASVLTPVFVSFSASTGVPLAPMIMVEAAALNTYFFPYQSAVLIAILSQSSVKFGELVKTTTIISFVTLLTAFPLQIGLFVLLY